MKVKLLVAAFVSLIISNMFITLYSCPTCISFLTEEECQLESCQENEE